MKRSRFSGEQIIAILNEQEAGTATAEVYRYHGISPASFYNWKSEYSGLVVSEAKRLRSLEDEDENCKLKRLLAEAMLVIAVLKDITEKSDAARRKAGGVAHARSAFGLSERRRFGYCRLGYLLAREGPTPNHKKLLREEGLKVRRRDGRKRALGTRAPMTAPQRWSLDFVSDAFVCGGRFRILCVIDDFSREWADTSLSGARVAR